MYRHLSPLEHYVSIGAGAPASSPPLPPSSTTPIIGLIPNNCTPSRRLVKPQRKTLFWWYQSPLTSFWWYQSPLTLSCTLSQCNAQEWTFLLWQRNLHAGCSWRASLLPVLIVKREFTYAFFFQCCQVGQQGFSLDQSELHVCSNDADCAIVLAQLSSLERGTQSL